MIWEVIFGGFFQVINMGRLTAAAAVALWLWTAAVAAEYVKYKDPQQPVEVRVRDLMSRMTLAEKIGQMTQIEREVSSADVINKYLIGSIVSGGGSVPRPQATAEDWIDMVNAFQKGALSTRLGIPLIYGIDAIHGNNNAYKATIFPHNVGLGVTRQGSGAGQEDRRCNGSRSQSNGDSLHLRALYSCEDPRWGRCYESYSEDHEIVQMMTEIIPGLQGEVPPNYPNNFPFVLPRGKVAGCSKHFVGDGGTAYGINENDTVIEWNELQDIHMPAYLDSIRKGVATIMISYSSLNGIRMHANYDLITGYLKNTLKFEGFVISDMRGIDRLTDPPHSNYTYSVQVSILAGLDMIMVPDAYKEFIDDLTFLVNANVIPMSRINDAVRRILRVKFIMGLFENPLADLSFAHYLGSQEHRELAREAVRKSLVLLKNGKDGDGQLVPLPTRSERILVAGSHADDIGNQCGGWTIDWEGHSGNITVGTTILTAVRNSVDPDTKVVYNENPEAEYVRANNFSYAIVVVGEPPYVESSGDSTTLTLDESAYATITNVCGAVRCVVVLVTGRPVVIEPYIGEIDALVAAWLPGTEGQGVADVLFGEYGFTGRLARTWFRTVDQLPMNVGDAIYDPLFPFGYGLMTSPRVMLRMNKMRVFLVFLCLWAAVAEAETLKYKDPKQPLNARIKDLMRRMTLEEKIGQMTQIESKVASPDVMKNYFIGSVLSGPGSVPVAKASAADWVNMVNGFQKGAVSTRLGIPMIHGIDAVHGHSNVYKATIFPHNVGLGVTRGLETFAPCIAVCRDPRWGRCFESYSEDHKIVQAMTEIIPGLQGDLPANSRKGIPFVAGKTKIAACAKHFVGDGGTMRGIDENNTVVDPKGLFGIHMPAYYDSIRKGVATVMISYSSWNGIKMHTNKFLITGFLKGRLKFRVMVPKNYTEFIDTLTSLVKSNVIPMSRIDDAVRRILRVKFVMGLFEDPLADLSLARFEHRELAREAVRKSLVLLKNSKDPKKPLLPLPKKARKILVAGTHADNLGFQCGGWTIEWQGFRGNNVTSGTTILAAIKKAVDPSTQVVFSENPGSSFVKGGEFSHAIVVVGELPYVDKTGDSTNLTITDPCPSTIRSVCGSTKCVVVVVSGRPVVMEPDRRAGGGVAARDRRGRGG
ncbi:hypothetical protein SASPL_122074 [Salvia splendens]|uniref:beta-glucosidase n=1 Tax=Salvia splendens TaxID=180675 RepID=A0A8X8ZS38_SALSN|nr:hypothetical protein SASPL_122074 [Salvia splendens]